jgi:hypothetical protein
MILCLLLVASLPSYCSAVRPVIQSSWTTTPPVIDGNFLSGEWSNLQLVFKSPDYPDSYVLPTYVYFLNDNSNLYVLVDAVGDPADGVSDECLLWFNFINTVKVSIIGASGTKINTNFNAAIGFSSSPNSASAHKIYEFCIPFSYINSAPGQTIDFCSPELKGGSMPFDFETYHDNIWPLGLIVDNLDTWGLIVTSLSRPVAGVTIPVNKPAVLAPYLALAGLFAALSATVAVGKRRRA